ncbi:hypothetical protein N8612_07255 [Verrucomicrobia bacterium]|nr:hypothetical protein [Verrucomicrobiota bacterium]
MNTARLNDGASILSAGRIHKCTDALRLLLDRRATHILSALHRDFRDQEGIVGLEEIGSKSEFEEALLESEDLSTLKTSFGERLNLTLRKATSYLAS